MIIFLPVYIVFRIIFVHVKKHKTNVWREIVMAVFAVYCFGLAILLFRNPGATGIRSFFDGIKQSGGRINYIPFTTIDSYITYSDQFNLYTIVENLLGNIFVFSPIGFALPILWKRWQKFWRVFLFGLITPVLIETIQYFTGRSADIDDVILNCLGVVIGYLVYKILMGASRVLPRLSE
jgi:glycopeptide antibiotics resistance protein